MMRVRLFGTLTIEDGDRRLGARSLGGLKQRQLFGLLALHHRPVTKDEIIDAVWGDRVPKDPAATLETCVSVLRRHLQPGVHRDGSVVRTGNGAYELARDLVAVDLDEFDALLADARAEDDPAYRLLALRTACNLSSHGLLDDDRYEVWSEAPRRHYDRLRLEVRLDAARLALAFDATDALRLADDALAVDPACEEGYRLAMQAAHAASRRDLVVRYLDRCREALDRELAVVPSPATLALGDALLAPHAPAVVPPVAALRPRVGAGPAASRPCGRQHRRALRCRWSAPGMG